MNSEMVQPCPMCGRMISAKLTTCPACGERIGEPGTVDPETAREADFRVLLNLLGMIWIGWGLFSGCANLTEFINARGHMPPGPLVLMVYVSCALAWFVSGLAALQKEMWGVYLGYVLSFLLLLASLFYLSPIGICVAVGFILLSRFVLKQYRQLKGSGASPEDE